MGVAIGVLVFSFLFSLLFCQYLNVSCKTLPRVRKQPVILGLEAENDFVEVNINHLSTEHVIAQNAGYGRMASATGMIEFQVFSPKAIGSMSRASGWSVIMFILCLIQIPWGCLWLYVGATNNGSAIDAFKWS